MLLACKFDCEMGWAIIVVYINNVGVVCELESSIFLWKPKRMAQERLLNS